MTILYFILVPMLINGGLNFLNIIHRHPQYQKFDYPIDFYLKINKQRLIGDSSTILGLALALILGTFLGSIVYQDQPLGLTIGFAVFFGHSLGSFVKRRLNIKPGDFLPIVDHGDYIIISGIFLLFLNKINLITFLGGLIITLIVHPVFCLLGFWLKIRNKKI